MSNNTQKTQNSQTKQVFLVDKSAGETLAVFVERFRQEQNIAKDVPVTYAGRLDPMASGAMLMLIGEECKNKDKYLKADKTYKFEVLFGIETDTLDMLGIVKSFREYLPNKQEVLINLEKIKTLKEFFYPDFSSKTVGGVPLFTHAKQRSLPIDKPKIFGEIKSIDLLDLVQTDFKTIVEDKIEIIKKVQGDFRQEEILKGWQEFIKEHGQEKYAIATIEATVSSGIYIRTICQLLGGLAYSIDRTKIKTL